MGPGLGTACKPPAACPTENDVPVLIDGVYYKKDKAKVTFVVEMGMSIRNLIC